MSAGRLVVVPTPIGNLEDLSPRAAAALGSADRIACEDTRRTGKLLHLLGIGHGPLLVVNDHTEAAMLPELVARVADGEVIALVTDAGTPGIADPGERVIRAVADAGLRVEVLPGPVAAIVALVASGLPAGRFVFEGFAPRKGRARRTRLAELAAETRTVVLLESPHRVEGTLVDLVEVCGPERVIAVARELTKLHEEVWRGPLDEALDHVREHGTRGEYVLVLDGAPPADAPGEDQVVAALAAARARGLSTRDAVVEVAASTGIARRRVYELATESTGSTDADDSTDGFDR